MGIKVQFDLSDDEGKIVELYRIQHNKKTNDEAAKEIIKLYKTPDEVKTQNANKNKKNFFQQMQGLG
jgi:hypothetical protein